MTCFLFLEIYFVTCAEWIDACFSGSGPHWAVQCPRGTIQAGCLLTSQEDGWGSVFTEHWPALVSVTHSLCWCNYLRSRSISYSSTQRIQLVLIVLVCVWIYVWLNHTGALQMSMLPVCIWPPLKPTWQSLPMNRQNTWAWTRMALLNPTITGTTVLTLTSECNRITEKNNETVKNFLIRLSSWLLKTISMFIT